MQTMNIIGWASLRRQTVRRQAWRSVSVMVGISTILNLSAVGALITPRMAVAAVTPTSGTITVQKQFDTNGDGVVDITGSTADPILAGWGFTVDTTPSAPVTKTTDPTGKLSFDVANGTYAMSETAYPTGFHLASAACTNAAGAPVGTFDVPTLSVTGIPVASNIIGCTFINTIDTASINGQKWNDLNGNGSWDEAAPAQISNWQMFLDTNNNGLLDAGEPTTTTSNVAGPDFGWYHFDDLAYGTYHVCETAQAGWKQTFPATANGCHTVSILDPKIGDTCTPAAPGDAFNLTCDFGNQQQAAIKVLKNVDTDGNGTIDITGATDWTWDLNGGNQNYATGSTQYATPSTTVTVKEDQKTGYHFTSVSCASATGSVQVAQSEQVSFPVTVGGSYTCTYTNTKSTAITVHKQGPTTATAGSNVTYTINWTVTGAPAATNAVITDPIPANMTFVSATNGGTLSTNTVTWNLGNQTPGATGSVTLTLKIASPSASGTVVTNTATFDTDQTDPASDSAATTVTSAASLTITKTNTVTAFVNPGAVVNYTVVVTNPASSTESANAVTLTDVLPAGLTYALGGGSTKTFSLGTIAPGASVITTYAANVSAKQKAGTYSNTATAKGSNVSTVSAISKVEVRIPVVLGATSPSMTLTKSVDVAATNPGQLITYTMVVTNTAKGNATIVVLTDTLPAGLTFVDGGAATKTWTIGTMKAGAKSTVKATVKVGTGVKAGIYTNKAVVTATGLDPVNAQANVHVTIPQVKGLATTGAGERDYLIFSFGLLLLAAGYTFTRRLRLNEK